MKYAHLIKLTAFSYEHEDSKSVVDAFLGFFPFNIEDNKVFLKQIDATGFNDKGMKIFEVTLTKARLINQLLRNIFDNINENQKSQILNQIEFRLDKNLDLFLRFDKDSWINERKLALTDSGKCFHLRISVAAFPKKRGIALNIVKDIFSEKLNKTEIK